MELKLYDVLGNILVLIKNLIEFRSSLRNTGQFLSKEVNLLGKIIVGG